MRIASRSPLRTALGIIALAAVAALGAPDAARAGTLTGDEMHLYFHYPDVSTVYYDLGTFTVPFARNDLGGYTWAVSGNQVTFTSGPLGAGPFGAGAFNGLEFVDITRDPGFTGVTVDPSTTVAPGSIPLVTFTSNTLFFNFAGQPRWFGSITYDLAFAAATTPVPPALPLFISALGGLGLLGWHRNRKADAAPFAA
jgi:hypothetical protein